LVAFDEALSSRDGSFVALVHGDLLSRKEYEADLFHTFRYLIRDSRKLVLLVQTRRPIATLLPQDHPLSGIEMIQVQLMGDPA
jgi:UDP-2,3-diacylglucosamine pyrophosphatase LpxH